MIGAMSGSWWWDALAVLGAFCLSGLVTFVVTVSVLEHRENTGLLAEMRDHKRYLNALRRATRRG